ncbi:WD40 repeat-like protein [Violaceomyces palustris]|uniref:WD40 repeat-like protein n=1 Tax=Violaceomyces palustris TaxID=1673888 RepID=A0ACD0NN10_9BASI|nr:WD40 repeat-like protein [Violaceomyces palustris]
MGSQQGFGPFGVQGGMNNGVGPGGNGGGMYMSNNGGMMLGGQSNGGGPVNPHGGGLGMGVGGGQGGQPNQNNNGMNGLQPQETGTSNSQPEYTLAGILHFLQSEWRRYERDRNEWEIERAEMRARIALLEGERRGVENLKTDLMRRVKMLEYALRQERSKYLSSGTTAGAPPKHPSLHGLEKTASGSGRSSPSRSEEMNPSSDHGQSQGHLARGSSGLASTGSYNPSTLGLGNTINGSTLMGSTGTFAGSTFGGTGQLSRGPSGAKDPRSRAKSRDYLKQCLQEINYLTSATTLNPLPERAGISGPQSSTRPRKIMMEVPPTMSQQDLPPQNGPSTGSLRRGPSGPGQLSLPNPGLGHSQSKGARSGSLTASRSPLLASEPVMEEASEAEAASERGFGSEPPSDPLGASLLAPTSEQAEEADTQHQQPARSLSPDGRFPFGMPFEQPETPAATTMPLPNGSPAQGEVGEQTSSHDPFESGSDSSDSSSVPSSGSVESNPLSADSLTDEEGENDQVTAIFKPGNHGDWARLKEAGMKEREKRDRERQQKSENAEAQLALTERVSQFLKKDRSTVRTVGDEEELANLSIATEDDENNQTARLSSESASDEQMWHSKKVLRSHLDAVRALAFAQNDICLLSCSDDNTIKFWKLDPSTLNQTNSKASSDGDPVMTFRGHSAPVTCLTISNSKRRIFSGSMDSSIRVWQLPDRNTETYPPFDKSMELGSLIGHTQAVWDMALLPQRTNDEALLATVSADGTVKIWEIQPTSPGPGQLLLSWEYFGVDPDPKTTKERENLEKSGGLPVPTSVDLCHSNLRLCAVAYTNSIVKLFDIATGHEVLKLNSDQTYDGTPGTQINKVVTHPTLPLLITAHEDRYIRMFDLDTGACTLSMIAHLDAVTSLDIDASGLTLVSGGHDCSVRFWDIVGGTIAKEPKGKSGAEPKEAGTELGQGEVAGSLGEGGSSDVNENSAICRQEMTSHRKKAGEGVLAVKYHPTAPYFASAGADGVIRIYG